MLQIIEIGIYLAGSKQVNRHSFNTDHAVSVRALLIDTFISEFCEIFAYDKSDQENKVDK